MSDAVKDDQVISPTIEEGEEIITKPSSKWSCEIDLQIDGLPSGDSQKKELGGKEGESSEKEKSSLKPISLDMLTVGRKFLLRCQGEPVFLNRDNIKLILPESSVPPSSASGQQTNKEEVVDKKIEDELKKKKADEFALKLLRVDRLDEKSADLVVTSYRAGIHKFKSLKISDGEKEVVLGAGDLGSESEELASINFAVASVLKPVNGKPLHAYGPFGPLYLEWPLIYWVLLATVILLPILLITRKIRHRIKRKKLVEELEEYNVATDPYNVFNKELRQVQRALGNQSKIKSKENAQGEINEEISESDKVQIYIDGIEKSLRLYLIRTFKLPAFAWSDAVLVKEFFQTIRKDFGKDSAQELKQELKLLLSEILHAKEGLGTKVNSFTFSDSEHLEKMCQKTVSNIWQQKQKYLKSNLNKREIS